MKIDRASYNTFFFESLRSKLVILEAQRVRAMNVFVILNVPIFVVLLMTFINQGADPAAGVFYLLAEIVVLYLSFRWIFAKYKKTYKEKIIPIVFEKIFDQFDFYPQLFLSEAEYVGSMLFQDHYNRYSGEDLIEGVFKGIKLRMSELHVKFVHKSGKNKSERTIFKGILINFNMKTPYLGQMIVEPDVAENLLGHVGKMLQFKNKFDHEVIRLESIEFEKQFVVRGSDQIEARKILTPAVQERISALAKKNKLNFGFSVSANQVSVAFAQQKDYFEPEYFSSNVNGKSIRSIVDVFLFVEELLVEIETQQ